jgi:hypothetical protein
VLGRTGPADGPACAGEFAEPFGRAVPLAGPVLAGAVLAGPVLAGAVLAGPVLAGAVLAGVDRGAADPSPDAAVADGWLWFSGPVAGLNVATDSMAPATRHTARMLASSGITVPCPRNGLVSRRSRCWRRRARSSRW